MDHQISCTWTHNMAFEADIQDHKVIMDAQQPIGDDSGPSPKRLILAALAGCTGIDVVSLLQKMRVSFDGLRIDVSGVLTEEHPKYYHQIHIIYRVAGKDVPTDKVEKAVNLSREKYCGVSAQLAPSAEITHEIIYE